MMEDYQVVLLLIMLEFLGIMLEIWKKILDYRKESCWVDQEIGLLCEEKGQLLLYF